MTMRVFFISCVFLIMSVTSYAQNKNDFFMKSDQLLQSYVVDGRVDYAGLKGNVELGDLVTTIAKTDVLKYSEVEKKAFYINAYNLLVISEIVEYYPVNSPMDINSFFDGVKHQIAGEKRTLNDIENKILRATYDDARFHFVLVCGAVGCPPIISNAYLPATLDAQMEQQAKLSINGNFISVNDAKKTVEVSEIMSWYKEDFTSKKSKEIDYLNKYRTSKIPSVYKISYAKYNWALNKQNEVSTTATNTASDIGANGLAQTYNAGSLLRKGKFDLTLFNSLYTQDESNWMGTDFTGFRETFYSTLVQFTLGTSKNARVNLGLDLTLRANGRSSDSSYSSITAPFRLKNNDSSRVGLTNVAFRVKLSPFKGNDNFSMQSSLSVPTINTAEGGTTEDGDNLYWADWNRILLSNQFFYTKDLGTKFQLFTEMDLLFRFKTNKDQISFLDLPVTGIISYFPTKKVTLYSLAQYVPRFPYNTQPDKTTDFVVSSSYTALGGGLKYQLSKKFQFELIYTKFVTATNAGLGESLSFGIKFLN